MISEQEVRSKLGHLIKQPEHKKASSQPKGYLNRTEREEVMVLAAVAGKLDDLIANWEEHKQSGVRIRAAKLSRYWAYQALEQYLTGVPEEEAEKVVKQLGRSRIVVLDK